MSHSPFNPDPAATGHPPRHPDLAATNHPPLDPHLAATNHPPLQPDLAAILTEIVEPDSQSGRFGHREHVHLAFIATKRGDAAGLLRDWLRQIAASHGAPDRYHETITTAWARIVAHHVSADPATTDFDSFAVRYPALLDKSLLTRHYSQAVLASPTARANWIAPGPGTNPPDLIPTPRSTASHATPAALTSRKHSADPLTGHLSLLRTPYPRLAPNFARFAVVIKYPTRDKTSQPGISAQLAAHS
jgi:hypothetical protein